MRPLLPADAHSLLREAVALNLKHQATGRVRSRFSIERDEIVIDLTAAGYPADYADYDHPSEV